MKLILVLKKYHETASHTEYLSNTAITTIKQANLLHRVTAYQCNKYVISVISCQLGNCMSTRFENHQLPGLG